MNRRSSFLSLFSLSMAMGATSVSASSSGGWLDWVWGGAPTSAPNVGNQEFEIVSPSNSQENLTIDDRTLTKEEISNAILSNLEAKAAKANVMGKMQDSLSEVLVIQADKRLKQTIAAELEELKTSKDLPKQKLKAMEAATFALAHKQITPKIKSSYEDRSLAETEFLNKFWNAKLKKLTDEIEVSHAFHQEELESERWKAIAIKNFAEYSLKRYIEFANKCHEQEIAKLSAEINATYLKNIALSLDKATLEKDIVELKEKEAKIEEFYSDMAEDYRELSQDYDGMRIRYDGLSDRLDNTYGELWDTQWALGIARVKLDETKESVVAGKQEAAYYRDIYAQLNMRSKLKMQSFKDQLQGALQESAYYRDLVARQGMLTQLKLTTQKTEETQVVDSVIASSKASASVLVAKSSSSPSSWAAIAKKKN